MAKAQKQNQEQTVAKAQKQNQEQTVAKAQKQDQEQTVAKAQKRKYKSASRLYTQGITNRKRVRTEHPTLNSSECAHRHTTHLP